MTPKEKAEELINRYNSVNLATGSTITTFQVKQCALIAVDEIIKSNPYSPSEFHLLPHFKAGQYWQEVKQEIEKL